MKNKGYAKIGGGWGQISCIMGDVQVAYYLVFLSSSKAREKRVTNFCSSASHNEVWMF